MKPCISEATTMASSFADDIAHAADAGCPALEVWFTKLEQHLQQHAIADTRQLILDRGVTLAAAAYQGGLLLSQGQQRAAHYDHFKRRLEICQAFGIGTLLVAADVIDKMSPASLQHAVDSLGQAAQWAAGFDVTLALEFRNRDCVCTNLETALAIVEQCGEPNVGVNLDVFHYFTGPSKFDDFAHLSPAQLAFVQMSDVAGVPRELAADSDRILPGDGDFNLAPIVEHLRTIGYAGWVSVELLNPILWQANPQQVIEIAVTSLRKLLGQSIPAAG